MKKILSVLLSILFCALIAIEAAAAGMEYVYDRSYDLDTMELTRLNDKAQSIYDKYEVAVYFITDESTPQKSAASLIEEVKEANASENCVIIASSSFDNKISGFGSAEKMFGDEECAELWQAFSEESKVGEDIMACFEYVEQLLEKIRKTEKDFSSELQNIFRIDDGAELFSADEKSLLENKFAGIKEELSFDVAVVTLNSLESGSINDFADEYYKKRNLGCGEEKDGALFVINAEGEKEYGVFPFGEGKNALNDNAISQIVDDVTSLIRNEDYAGAVSAFAEDCSSFILSYRNGNESPDDGEAKSKDKGLGLALKIIISAAVGAVLSYFAVFYVTKNHEVISENDNTSERIIFTKAQDMFLYSTVCKSEKQISSALSESSDDPSDSQGDSSSGAEM